MSGRARTSVCTAVPCAQCADRLAVFHQKVSETMILINECILSVSWVIHPMESSCQSRILLQKRRYVLQCVCKG